MMTLVLALRGVAAVLVLTTLAGGIPRIVQAGLAAVLGLWSALLVGAEPDGPVLVIAARELVVGATLGILAALPLVAAALAGRLVEVAGSARRGPYATLFGILAAAVFVGIDGHVAVITSLVDSFRTVPAIATTQPRVLAALGGLVPSAVTLAIPPLTARTSEKNRPSHPKTRRETPPNAPTTSPSRVASSRNSNAAPCVNDRSRL